MTMIRGKDFTGGVPDKATKFNAYLQGLQTSGLPIDFSEKGVRNLAARFALTETEAGQQIAAFRKGEGGLAG